MEILRSQSPGGLSHRSSPSPRRSESPMSVSRSLVSPSSRPSISPISSVGSLVKPEKKSALDIVNILGTSSSSKSSHQSSKISSMHSVKAIDFALASRLSNGHQYKAFYPYQALTHGTANGASNNFPYPDSSTGALTTTTYGAYPFYGLPLPESANTASLSSLRLSALLASRRRRAAQSNSDPESEADSSDPNEPCRKKVKPVPDDKKDNAYWERRRKNNDAAKRSRDARRAKEEEIALRAVILEQENMKLRAEVSILKSELARLHYMVYNC